uniref:hypothetical protein n=1 Tax=Paracoccus sp. TRP TaxID=412597 RepID=UPI00110FD310
MVFKRTAAPLALPLSTQFRRRACAIIALELFRHAPAGRRHSKNLMDFGQFSGFASRKPFAGIILFRRHQFPLISLSLTSILAASSTFGNATPVNGGAKVGR